MIKNVLVIIYTVFAATVAFLLGLILTSKAITNGVIRVNPTSEPTTLVVELDSVTKKNLVPFGHVNSDDETDVIKLKYQVEITKGLKRYILNTKVLNVTVDGDSSLSHLFIFELPKGQQITKHGYLDIKIRMLEPKTPEEYQKITSGEVIITFEISTEPYN